jgi:hypothetical protein
MERLRGVFIVVFMVCWLMLVGQSGSSFSFDSQSAADSAQTSAPTDNDDDPSGDGTLADDFTIQSRRIELAVPLRPVLTTARPVSNPRVRHQTASFVLPHIWQFVERTAAVPRAPTFLA